MVAVELVLNLNLISLDVNSVTLFSNSSSKLVSIKRLLLGSSKVMFEEAGELFIIKDSPFLIATETLGLSLIFIFKFSLKVKAYFNSWSTPSSTCISNVDKFPFKEWSSLPFFSIEPEITPFIAVPSGKFIIGEAVFEKSIFPIPLDSTLLSIPSLSRSRSILFIIPSPSKSVGHWLIGISDE